MNQVSENSLQRQPQPPFLDESDNGQQQTDRDER